MTDLDAAAASAQPFRERANELLASATGDDAIAERVEAALFEACVETAADDNIAPTSRMFQQLYVSKARQLIDNLDPAGYVGNATLLPRLRDGSIGAADVARMSPQELFPELWRQLLEEKDMKEEIKYAARQQATTHAYRCRRCGSRECTFYELQTRSIDEPTTAFITCLACGSAWKN